MRIPLTFGSKKIKTSELLSTSLGVWTYLCHEGGLLLDTYDSDLRRELFDLLRGSFPGAHAGSLEDLLEDGKVPVEEFLSSFFSLVQPYGEMMNDLLQLFVEAKAQESNSNLRVHFDFGKDLPFNFDINEFRQWTESWEQVSGNYLTNNWSIQDLWDLRRIFAKIAEGENISREVQDSRMKKWLEEYFRADGEGSRWPDDLPPPPEIDNTELSKLLLRIWTLWQTVVRQSRRFGVDRKALRKPPENDGTQELGSSQRGSREPWSREMLAHLDSDFWAGNFSRTVYQSIEEIRRISAPQNQIAIEALIKNLDELSRKLEVTEIEGDMLQRKLEEFLSLPIWKKRHELYSVWVSTQIIKVLNHYKAQIHSVEGRLLFEFRGTHLVTFESPLPTLHLMAELRSPLSDPRGHGRKKAIQPDYSLVTNPVHSPESSILEVECKQYLKASKKNFSDALNDYAKGRVNAQIVIVNYGEAKDDIRSRVDADIRMRTHVVGKMRLGSRDSLERFRQLVLAAVNGRYRATVTDGTILSPVANFRRLKDKIVLSWDSHSVDLDLYLNIVLQERTLKVFYSLPGDLALEPWARLDSDIRHGGVPETIEITRWQPGVYFCKVHNFSSNLPLAACGARVKVCLGNLDIDLKCPEGAGAWWHVFSYSCADSKLRILNQVTDREDFS